jgi:hypothetical protein
MRRFDLIILGIILSIWLILSGCQRQAQELSVRAPLLLGVIFYSERDGRGGLYFWDWRTHRIRPFTSYDEVVSPFSLLIGLLWCKNWLILVDIFVRLRFVCVIWKAIAGS